MTNDWQVHWVNGASRLDRLVLASGSPRRRDLLATLGVPILIVPPDVPEEAAHAETPSDLAVRLAKDKAEAVSAHHPEDVVVAADTVVAIGGAVLGKPLDEAEAADMLRRLSGRTHDVVTGVAVQRGRRVCAGSERTAVTFRPLGEAEIRAYVATEEPHDKAGAYAAQGRGSLFIARVDGCFYNVVGLPLVRLRALIRELEGMDT